MRVIAGKFRSRVLKGPKNMRLRPTSDRLRETLFNVLGPTVQDTLFIDLYAGTGAVGMEALSRGSREVIFVESNAKAASLIRANLAALGITAGAEVMETATLRGLGVLATRHVQADFIFLDPPYDSIAESERVLEFLNTSRLLAPGGLVIAEHRRKSELPARFERLARIRVLEQGDAALSFYRLAAAA